MARNLSKKNSVIEEPFVNLTPLIDVVFVILIAFIVIAPLLEREEVDLASGGGFNSASVKEASLISIKVFKDNTFSFNGKRVSEGELLSNLISAKNSYPSTSPQLFHDRNASFGTYQKIKSLTKKAGFTSLEVILEPDE